MDVLLQFICDTLQRHEDLIDSSTQDRNVLRDKIFDLEKDIISTADQIEPIQQQLPKIEKKIYGAEQRVAILETKFSRLAGLEEQFNQVHSACEQIEERVALQKAEWNSYLQSQDQTNWDKMRKRLEQMEIEQLELTESMEQLNQGMEKIKLGFEKQIKDTDDAKRELENKLEDVRTSVRETPSRPVFDPANGNVPNTNLGHLYDTMEDVAQIQRKLDIWEKRIKKVEDNQYQQSQGTDDGFQFTVLNRKLATLEKLTFENSKFKKLIEGNKQSIIEMQNKFDGIYQSMSLIEERIETILSSSPLMPKQQIQTSQDQLHLTPRLTELMNTIDKKYADKEGTYKALKYLERLIKSLVKPKDNQTNDAILAKRPLGGWSCASCAGQLQKSQSQQKGYNA